MDDGARDAARLDVLDALLAVHTDLPALVGILGEASSRPEAAARLRTRFGISEAGAEAVLDTQLYRLTGVHRERLAEERADLARRIAGGR